MHGCGASGVGRSPTPDSPPSGRAAGAHYPLAVGAGGCGRGDPSPTPQRAPLRAAFACCGGGTRAPGGGASCLGVGRPGTGALPPPTARPLGGLPGPTTHWLWVRGGAGVGTRHQPHSACCCVLWGRHEGARGGRLLPGCGASGVGRSSDPNCPPSGQAAGAHYPLAMGAGGCGRGDPSPTPQRALLHAVGAARGRPGGAPPAFVWGVHGLALSKPRLPALWAGCRGPLHTGCGCGGVRVWGPVTNPTARALACCGGGLRVPAGGASCLGVGRLRSGTLPAPTARPLAGLPGPTTQWLWVRAGAGVGTHHQHHSARSCELALRAVGAERGCPGGAPPAWVWGVRGQALSHPRLPALWVGCWGPLLTGCGCGGVRAWGPVTKPTARAFACCGSGMRVPGGCASCLGVGRPGSGTLPPPTARPLGRLPGLTTHWLWVPGGAGLGTRHQCHSTRSCELALRAVGAAQGRPGGGASCLGVGRAGSGALPTPTVRPLGGLPGPTTHWLWLRGGAGAGTRHQPHSARSCVLALRAVGTARGRPGGAPSAWVWGVRGRALSHHRLPALWAGCRGKLPTACGCGGLRAWGPVTNPTAHALACGRGGMRVPGGGGTSCMGVGRPASGALPPPTPRPLGGLPGPTTHWRWVRVGAGVGTRHQPYSARPCELPLRAVGAARGRPGGAPPAFVWGVRGRALSHPQLPVLWAGCRGSLPTACGCGGMRAWGPVTNPTARALASWLCALLGRHEGARRGRLPPGCVASGVGRSPTPDWPPSGRAAGAHYPLASGAGGCGRGDPSPTPQRALLHTVGAARGRPGGAPPAFVWGVHGLALSQPRLPALWAGCRGPLHTGCGCEGVRVWGPVTNPTARALACCGGGMRMPGGGASCLGVGRLRSGTLPAPTARPLAGLPGPTTQWLWVRAGAGVGTHHQHHSARSCELALRAVGAERGCPGGAPPAWVWGVRGQALSHPRLPALWVGCWGPLLTGCGCGGVRAGDPSLTPQRALLRAVGAA